MYLSDQLFTFIYESGNEYVASLDEDLKKIRLFWEEDDGEFQCFTTFGAVEPSGEEWKSLEEIKIQSRDLIVAHELEPAKTIKRIVESDNVKDYPPEE